MNGETPAELEYSLSTIDIPNNVTMYFVYNMPFGEHQSNFLLRQLIQGWALSGTFQHEDGTPVVITATGCNDPFGGTCFPNYNPNYVGRPRINGGWGRENRATGTSIQYIDPAAFEIPAAYPIGNLRRTAPYGLRNPGGYNENLSLRRSFPIHERLNFTFEASAFNVDGQVDFGAPNATFSGTAGEPGVLGTSAFGTVKSQADSPRDFQFSGRFAF